MSGEHGHLSTAVSPKYPNAKLADVEKIVGAFIAQVDELYGYYRDSTFGFRATLAQLALAEVRRRKESPNADFNSEPVYFGSGHRKHPASRVLHETTVEQLRKRNSERGINCIRAAQNFIVLLHSFWEHEYRPLLTDALGIETKETRMCETCKRKLPGTKTELQVPIMGDVRRLRDEIIHHGGVLKKDMFNRLERLQVMRGIDLVSGLKFTALKAEQEIRLFGPDVFFLLTLVRKAMDDIIIAAGGADPKYSLFKPIPNRLL